MKFRTEEVQLFHVNRKKDRHMTKLTVGLHDFANEPKNSVVLEQSRGHDTKTIQKEESQ
jgi:hypothetical protein